MVILSDDLGARLWNSNTLYQMIPRKYRIRIIMGLVKLLRLFFRGTGRSLRPQDKVSFLHLDGTNLWGFLHKCIVCA